MMMSATLEPAATFDVEAQEEALLAFLDTLPEAHQVTVRTLAHAWQGGGGVFQVGQWSIRLLVPEHAGQAGFTAGNLHRPRGEDDIPRLELCRIILENHGVDADQWLHWTDEFAELQHHGFDHEDRFPTVPISADLTDTEAARLALGLRDLARICLD